MFTAKALPILTVIAQVLVVGLVIFFLAHRSRKADHALASFIKDNALWAAFIVALVATSGSLFYSEILGYEPCKLCWYQRILMYPQVIILGLAIVKKQKFISNYSIALSALGAVIAYYHYFYQVTGLSLFKCDVVGLTASCSQRFVMEYGYITIPLMSATAFTLLIVLMVALKIYDKK